MPQAFFARALRIVRILWGALTFSNIVIGVVTFILPSPVPPPRDWTQIEVLAALALAAAVASFIIPARFAAKNLALSRPELAPAEPTAAGTSGTVRFAHLDQAGRQAMGMAQIPFMLSMALSEVVSMFGLVVHMQGAPMAMSTAFIVAGTLLAAVRFPTLARLVGPYERRHGATFAA